jgi:hypothetical protein
VLQFSEDGINFRQRWEMETLYCERDFAASKYPIHEVDPAGTVHTSILVKDDCLINLHQVTATKPLVLREGGYPLGFDQGKPEVVSVPGGEAAYIDGKLSFIRNLGGWSKQHPARGFGDDINGSNVRYRQSVVPVLSHETSASGSLTLATMVCGRVGGDAVNSLMGVVSEIELVDNRARLCFHDGERAFVQIGDIGKVTLDLNGKSLSGEIVLARVAADGKRWFVLHRDGTVDRSGTETREGA